MSNTCDLTKQFVDNLDALDKLRENLSDDEIRKLFPHNAEDISDINESLAKEETPNEDNLNKVINEKHGRHDEKKKLVTKIIGIVNANESIRKLVNELVLHSIPANAKSVRVDKNRNPILESLPLSSLRFVYANALKMSRAGTGEKFGVGLFGKLKVQLHTPKELAKLERTGSVYDMVDSMQRFAERISYRIAEFIHKPKSFKSDRNYGMHDILEDVKNLQDFYVRENIEDIEEKLIRMYTMLMSGWVYFDKKTDKLMIHSQHGPTGKKYETTDDPVYAFMFPVELKDYQRPGGEVGDLYIPLEGKVRQRMKSAIEKTNKINKEVFKYTQSSMLQSVNNILKALKKGLPSLSVDEVRVMFYSFNYKKTEAYSKLNKDEKRLVAKLYDTFEDMTMIEPIIFESTHVEEKGQYFPILYNKFTFGLLWDDLIQRKIDEIEGYEESFKATVGQERLEFKSLLSEARKTLKRAEYIRDRMDEYPSDVLNDITMPLARDIKHVEHITNAIDIRNMRTDEGVYYSYLKNIMSAVERNNLTADMIKSYIKAESDGAREYIEGIYKVPFNNPKTPAGFGHLNYSVDNVVRTMEKVGISIDPQNMTRKLKIVASFLTGRYLGGVQTSLQNWGAINQNIIDYGWKRLFGALRSYERNKKQWTELINKSGIVEFQEFFARSMINEMASSEVGAKTYDIIIGAYLSFYAEKKKAKTTAQRVDAVDTLSKNIERALSESGLWVSEISGIPGKKRLKKRRRILTSKRRHMMVQKFVNYAINYEFEANKHVKGFKSVPYKGLAALATAWAKFRTSAPSVLTMGGSEAFIRSTSFIIGIQKLQEAGMLPPGPAWEYKGQDLERAIEIGRSYARYTNFGLSTQDVGQMNWGPFGNMMGKFKFWSQQKFGRDANLFKNAYNATKTMKDVEGSPWKIKVISKMILKMGKSNLRDTDPEVAKLRAFLLTQGVATVMFDLLVSPVALIPGMRGVMMNWIPMGRVMRGVTSDYLSFMMMPLILMLRALFYDDDEEDIERTASYYLRRTMFGFAPLWTYEVSIMFISAMADEMKIMFNKGSGVVSPFVPYSGLIKKAID